jgi:hypothetical protein
MRSAWMIFVDIVPVLAMAAMIVLLPLLSEGPPDQRRRNDKQV